MPGGQLVQHRFVDHRVLGHGDRDAGQRGQGGRGPRFALTEANLDDVVAICRRLDGLPLALELAAARLRLLGPAALLARLDESLGSETAGADRPERHRTLRATISWSHALLGPTDQVAFRRLAAFQTARDADTVEQVLAVDDIDVLSAVARLVDASLVRVVEGTDGELSFTMLQTVRAFAREQLMASADADKVLHAHAAWCAEQARQLEQQLLGRAPLAAIDAIDQALPDIRAALRHTLRADDPDRLALAVTMVSAMNAYLYRYRFADEARYWHERLLSVVGDDDSAELAQALHGTAIAMLQQDEFGPAEQMLRRALDIARRMGDQVTESRELNSLGVAAHDQGDLVEAVTKVEESLAIAEAAGAPRRISSALTNLTAIYTDQGNYPAALAAAERAIGYERELGDLWGEAIVEVNRCVAMTRVHGPAAAHRRLVEVARWVDEVGDADLVANVLELFCLVLSEQDDHARAVRLAGAADQFRQARRLRPTGSERRTLEQALIAPHAALSDREYAAELAAGRRLEPAAAFALAAEPVRADPLAAVRPSGVGG